MRRSPQTSAVFRGKRAAAAWRNCSTLMDNALCGAFARRSGGGQARAALLLELPCHVGADGAHRVEVLGQHLLVRHLDAEGALQEADELEHAGRVDDAVLEER